MRHAGFSGHRTGAGIRPLLFRKPSSNLFHKVKAAVLERKLAFGGKSDSRPGPVVSHYPRQAQNFLWHAELQMLCAEARLAREIS